MAEIWDIEICTLRYVGATSAAARVCAELRRVAHLSGQRATLDHASGVIMATFRVHALDAGHAGRIGFAAFQAALQRSQLEPAIGDTRVFPARS